MLSMARKWSNKVKARKSLLSRRSGRPPGGRDRLDLRYSDLMGQVVGYMSHQSNLSKNGFVRLCIRLAVPHLLELHDLQLPKNLREFLDK